VNGRQPSPPMVSVYDGRDVLGFIINRGRMGFEGFDCEENSLGFFGTQPAAANAIYTASAKGGAS
jgi:hypothetical protein